MAVLLGPAIACDYETSGSCGHIDLSADMFMWTRQSGKVTATGRPAVDHTYQNISGKLSYLQNITGEWSYLSNHNRWRITPFKALQVNCWFQMLKTVNRKWSAWNVCLSSRKGYQDICWHLMIFNYFVEQGTTFTQKYPSILTTTCPLPYFNFRSSQSPNRHVCHWAMCLRGPTQSDLRFPLALKKVMTSLTCGQPQRVCRPGALSIYLSIVVWPSSISRRFLWSPPTLLESPLMTSN